MEGDKPRGWAEIMGHLNSMDGWKPMDVDAKAAPGVIAFKKSVPTTTVEMIKAEGVLEGVQAEKLFTRVFTQTFEEKRKSDESFIAEEVLQQDGDNSKVMFQAYSAPWPVSSRDLVFRRTKVVEDGIFYQIDFSEPHEKKPESGTIGVRASLLSCYRYKQQGDNCHVTWMVLMDPKGNVPGFVVNMSTGKVPLRIAGMKALLE